MRSNYSLTIFHVSILATLVLTLDADSGDSNCETEIKVLRNTVYNANVGQELRINCTVCFCNNSAPTVSWYKLEKNGLTVDVSSSSHIKTAWTRLKHSEGILFLIFKNILSNNSGQYGCRGGGSVSHTINVFVYEFFTEDIKPTTAAWTTMAPEIPTQDYLRHHVYRVVGIIVFVVIVTGICVTSKKVCKGVHCARGSRTTADQCTQTSDCESLSPAPIYENEH